MKNLYILFITPLCIALFSATGHAAQVAIVTAQRAIVYTDQALTSPIGFVRNGRKLMVGSTARQRGTIVPIVVSGKIAYIQVKDIALSDQYAASLAQTPNSPRVLEHKIDEDIEEFKYNLRENNYVLLSMSATSAQGTIDNPNLPEDALNSTLSTTGLMFEHRPEFSRYSFGIGLSYHKMSKDFYSMKTLTLDGRLYYSFIRSRFFSVEAFGTLSISGDFRYEDEYTKERASAYGYQFGGQIRLLPRSQYGLVAGVTYQALVPIGLDAVDVMGSNQYIEIDKLSGVGIFAALAYKF